MTPSLAAALAIALLNVAAPSAAPTASALILHIDDHPLPSSLDLTGAAVAPESDLKPCSRDFRRALQPDLDAVSSLVSRAGGKRTAAADFPDGANVQSADGLSYRLTRTPNGSYVVLIDSTHSRVHPERYFDACLRLASGTSEKIDRLGLKLPPMNLEIAQYSPALGFYIYTAQ